MISENDKIEIINEQQDLSHVCLKFWKIWCGSLKIHVSKFESYDRDSNPKKQIIKIHQMSSENGLVKDTNKIIDFGA